MIHKPAKYVPAQGVNFESESETLPATLFDSAPVGVVLCPTLMLNARLLCCWFSFTDCASLNISEGKLQILLKDFQMCPNGLYLGIIGVMQALNYWMWSRPTVG